MSFFSMYLFNFLLGGSAYCTIEVLYRGRTHYSMFFAGGIILISCIYFERMHRDVPLLLKCLFGAVLITVVEFLFGVVFNLLLHMQVWDYSNMPLNLLGQICLPFTLIWFLFSFLLFRFIIPNNPYS